MSDAARDNLAADTPVALRHRYPWSTEEIIILVVVSLIPVGAAALMLRGGIDSEGLAGLVAIFMVCDALAVYLFRLGHSRKSRSQVTGWLTGAEFSFAGGRFDEGSGSLHGHQQVRVRSNGREKALVFSRPDIRSSDGERESAEIMRPDVEVVVPLRLVRTAATGRDALVAALLQHGSPLRHSDEARVLMDELRS